MINMEKSLKNKKIVVGVTGSIAAYKSALLVRELIKAGAEIQVVMTPAATKFITTTTLESLSRHPVVVEMFDDIKQTSGAWHVQLAQWADLMIIAPCSATTLSKVANGLSDTALVCVAMALPPEKPLLIAPAMDFDMWQHPATQNNIRILKSFGYTIIPAAEGELASGLIGPGRLPDIPVLMDYIFKSFDKFENKSEISLENNINNLTEKPLETIDESLEKDKWNAELELEMLKKKMQSKTFDKLKGKRILITAGPTIEKIDSVRFISNFSSGKMGFALANFASEIGAAFILISGPTQLEPPANCNFIPVQSAEQMYQEVMKHFPNVDVAIFSAAVADFTPKIKFEHKMKKEEVGESVTIELVRTKDILAEAGKSKSHQFIVGFALETDNLLENAKRKLQDKNCDLIVANLANAPDSGFGGDKNTITIIDRLGKETKFMPLPKLQAAKEILKAIAERI